MTQPQAYPTQAYPTQAYPTQAYPTQQPPSGFQGSTVVIQQPNVVLPAQIFGTVPQPVFW